MAETQKTQPESLPNMKSDNIGQSEYFKIIRQFIKCHAGDGDVVAARQAVEAITPVAEQGNARAQYVLGMYYYTCHSEDPSRFLPWMERAADDGNMKAIKFLADYYRFICDDMEPERRKELGRKWLYRMIEVLTKKADKGVVSAAKSLMSIYVYDRPCDMTEKEALEAAAGWHERLIGILREKAERGTVRDKKNLADALYDGCDIPEEIDSSMPDRTDDAVRLYEEISDEKKDGASYYELGRIYSREVSEEKAFECYMKAAEMGYADAYYNVAAAYLDGEGVERDFDKAFEWFKKAADGGDSYAKLKLAECYKRGAGCQRDYAAAMALYQQVAGEKSKKRYSCADVAEYELGNMYLKGLGVDVDLRKAYDYFKRAAAHDNRAAENALNNKKFRDFRR